MGLDDDLKEVADEKAIADETGANYKPEVIEAIRKEKIQYFERPQTLPVIDRQIKGILPVYEVKDKKYGAGAAQGAGDGVEGPGDDGGQN